MNLAHEPPLRLGGLLVRPATREVEHATGRETLEPRVMEVLVALARADGAVVSRDDLIAACWDGRVVSDDAINRVISRIRRLAAQTGEKDFQLETITKVGYRLIAAPSAAPSAALDDVPSAVGSAPQAPAAGAEPPASPAPKRSRRIPSIAAAALAVFLTLGFLAARLIPSAPASAPVEALTLAVMPFDNIGGVQETAYIADGLSREIRNMLSRVRGLRVIADSSSFAVAQEPIGAVEIGDRLGADLLLDGSVRQSEGLLRVTLELVDADTGAQTWTGALDFPADDLARGQDALFVAVLEELVRRLGPDRIEIFASDRPRNPVAYRLVLQARRLGYEATNLRQQGRLAEFASKSREAEQIARQAVAEDPGDGDALVLLALIIGGGWSPELPGRPGAAEAIRTREAMDLFGRALAVDPDNTAALTTLAERYRRLEWRWAESETLLRRALALDPNFDDAHTTYAYLLSQQGRCLEGLEHARIAALLDPEFLWRKLAEPRLLKCAGRRGEANALYRRYLDEDREQAFLATEIYFNHITDGDAVALRAVAAHIRDDLWKGETIPAPMAAALARMDAGADALEGRPAALLAILATDDIAVRALADRQAGPTEFGRSPVDTLWTLAIEHAVAGDADGAVELLGSALNSGSLYIPETMPYGAYEFTPEVRAHPRYQALWRSDPRLVELTEVRLKSARDRQMEGVLPNGRRVHPKTE